MNALMVLMVIKLVLTILFVQTQLAVSNVLVPLVSVDVLISTSAPMAVILVMIMPPAKILSEHIHAHAMKDSSVRKSVKTSMNVLMAAINVQPKQLAQTLMVATIVHVHLVLKEMVPVLE